MFSDTGRDRSGFASLSERMVTICLLFAPAIGDRIDGCWMETHTTMTAFYFDALRHTGRLLPAALPSARAIGSLCPLDQGEVIVVRIAASSLTTPLANEATRLMWARSIHGGSPSSALRRSVERVAAQPVV